MASPPNHIVTGLGPSCIPVPPLGAIAPSTSQPVIVIR